MASYFPILRDQVLNRLWGEGRWKSVERRLEYCQAQNNLHQRQRIPVPTIVEFFRKYKFQRFTYDPSNPIDKEFDRLCQQRQWGQVKISQAWEEYDLAELQSALWQQQLEQSLSRSAINEIFQNHEVDIFTYDASADPITNLQRLIARQKKILKDLQKQQRKSALAVVEFFSQYEFVRYTYDPSNPPDVEFRRLCQQRQWGRERTRQARQGYNFAQQQLALSQQQQSLARSSFAYVIRNQEFVDFTCDTSADPIGEFWRLLTTQSKALKALQERTSAPDIVEFFKEYEFQRFTYDPSNPPDAEFQRLCQQRQWGPVRIAQARLEYEDAQQESIPWQEQWGQPLAQSAVVEYFGNRKFDNSGYDTSSGEIPLLALVGELPAVKFLRAQSVEGYTYGSSLLHEEFRGLLNAREAEWEASLPAESNQATFLATGHALAPTTAREEWIEEWRTIERELREEFQFKIENEFNVLMDFIGKSAGLEAWEVLVELYGVGKALLGQDGAERALESVNVNIYDFIGAIKDALRVPTKGNVGSPIPLLAPSVQKLNFPDEHMLSFYSKYTDRVFNRNNAMEHGTLVFLLRPLAQHWKDYKQQKKHFEEEAGWGALALIRGGNARPHAIRELLLSRRWSFLHN